MGIIILNILKFIAGAFEAFLGIPFIGGIYIISSGYTPLFIMLCFHIAIVIIAKYQRQTAYGNALGIFTSLLAWIPIVGMILHIITSISIFIGLLLQTRKVTY